MLPRRLNRWAIPRLIGAVEGMSINARTERRVPIVGERCLMFRVTMAGEAAYRAAQARIYLGGQLLNGGSGAG